MLNSVVAVLLVFAYISPFVNPGITLFFSIFGLFYPVILFTNILFVALWLVIKPKRALLSSVLILAGFGALNKTIGLNMSEESSGIKVITYNIGKTRVDFSRKNRNKHIRQFKDFIAKSNPDIICIQERTRWHRDIYHDIFDSYHVYPDNELGTAIYSRYPIIDGGNMPFETVAHNASWADVKIEKDTVRFYSVHLSSNRITNTTAKMLDNPDPTNTKIWGDLRFIFTRYNHHAQLRSEQIERILAHADQSPYPVVISGDFNDVPQSYIYRKICKQYNDAFTEAGFGVMKTFVSVMPALRIDYTFTGKKFNVVDHYIINTTLSDHYPVVTILDHTN